MDGDDTKNGYRIDALSRPGVLLLELRGALSATDIDQYASEVERTIKALGGAPYRIFCDSSRLLPLSPEGAARLLACKEFSAAQRNFEGSAVLVASSVIAMQHRRTSTEGRVMSTELISDDQTACWEHLRRVQRTAR